MSQAVCFVHDQIRHIHRVFREIGKKDFAVTAAGIIDVEMLILKHVYGDSPFTWLSQQCEQYEVSTVVDSNLTDRRFYSLMTLSFRSRSLTPTRRCRATLLRRRGPPMHIE